MGLLQLPRIYFKGQLWWNPSTFNNNDYMPTYDPANARLDWAWLEQQGVRTADEFRQFVLRPRATDSKPVASSAPVEWNFFGDNSLGFLGENDPVIEDPEKFGRPSGSTVVTGYTDADGGYVGRGDPWIGLPIALNPGDVAAKLVDVDPVAFWSSQLFATGFALGDGRTVGMRGNTAGRSYARWLNLGRNCDVHEQLIIAGPIGTVFQLGVDRQELAFLGGPVQPGSVADQLRRSLDAPGVRGVIVRFVAYLTTYFHGPAFAGVPPGPEGATERFRIVARLFRDYAEQMAEYRAGARLERPKKPVNRAYSRTVGWIAPWTSGELRTAPGGRILMPAGAVRPARDPDVGKASLGPLALEAAVADGAVQRISLDLGSTVPERDAAGTKVDFGDLELGLVSVAQPAEVWPVARVPYGAYDRDAYERTSGVVDIAAASFLSPLTADDLASGTFVVRVPDRVAGAAPVLGMAEQPWVAETDDRGVYVDEPSPPWSGLDTARTVAIQVRYLGGRPPEGARLALVQYSPSPPSFGESAWEMVSSADAKQQRPYVDVLCQPVEAGDGWAVVAVPLDPGAPASTVEVGVRARRPGFPILGFVPLAPGQAFQPEGARTVPAPAVLQQFYAVTHVLPFQNLLAEEFAQWLKTSPDAGVVTQRVWDVVFRTYSFMYPAMAFLGDPTQFQAWRGHVLAVTDPAAFERASYMPVTRDLSAGQRRILELWTSYLSGQLSAFVRGERPARSRRRTTFR